MREDFATTGCVCIVWLDSRVALGVLSFLVLGYLYRLPGYDPLFHLANAYLWLQQGEPVAEKSGAPDITRSAHLDLVVFELVSKFRE